MALEMAHQWGWHFTEFPCRKTARTTTEATTTATTTTTTTTTLTMTTTEASLWCQALRPLFPTLQSSSTTTAKGDKNLSSILPPSQRLRMLLSLVGDDAGRDVESGCILSCLRGKILVQIALGHDCWICFMERGGVFFPDQWDERPSETRILKKGVRYRVCHVHILFVGWVCYTSSPWFRSLRSIRFCQAFEHTTNVVLRDSSSTHLIP